MLTDIEIVRLYIGDTENSAFYPKISDEEIEYFIELSDGNLQKAARLSARAVLAYVAGIPIRERTGQIEVWNNISSNYPAIFNDIVSTPVDVLLSGVRPWSAGLSPCDRNPLSEIFDPCESPYKPKTPCGC